jgi:hypothetical protein
MNPVLKFTVAAGAFAVLSLAQGQQKGAPPTPSLPCGMQGDAEVICGTRSPEDLELTPDGKYLIVSQFVTGPGGPGVATGANGLYLFDIAQKTFQKLVATSEPQPDWGDSRCPGPVGDALAPHGISLVRRLPSNKMQLYVVNHGMRESIEMFELLRLADTWELARHGCVVSPDPYNDVAALADGGFIATHPDALTRSAASDTKGKGGPNALTSGQPSGFMVRWAAGGEGELQGTRQGYPNGVVATPDARFAYYNAWTAKEVHKYDLRLQKDVAVMKLDFMPDNLTFTKKGNLLAAGIKGLNGDCAGQPCREGFEVVALDSGKLSQKKVYDSAGKGALIPGVSVALQVGDSVYIGAFQGDRLVKVKWKE